MCVFLCAVAVCNSDMSACIVGVCMCVCVCRNCTQFAWVLKACARRRLLLVTSVALACVSFVMKRLCHKMTCNTLTLLGHFRLPHRRLSWPLRNRALRPRRRRQPVQAVLWSRQPGGPGLFAAHADQGPAQAHDGGAGAAAPVAAQGARCHGAHQQPGAAPPLKRQPWHQLRCLKQYCKHPKQSEERCKRIPGKKSEDVMPLPARARRAQLSCQRWQACALKRRTSHRLQ
jgi:hypothetical protein